MKRRIAFYAPLKSPDHPVPSGDRTVARLYRQALEQAGFTVDLVSGFRSLEQRGDAAAQAALFAAAATETATITQALQADLPALWFTYHCHYKAPDLLGPEVTAALGIPYIVAEPSHAPKRAGGAWAAFHTASEVAIARADLALCATARDRECVARLRGARPTLALPPFMDTSALPPPVMRQQGEPLRLITIAMMREGDKLASYKLLAEALDHLPKDDWMLTIVGDGPASKAVEALFARHAERVAFAGLVAERAGLWQLLAGADLFVWPAVNEAYGMAPLEAQAMGVPVVLGDEGGVADVLRAGETSVLVAPRDPAAMAAAVAALMVDRERLAAMSIAATSFVRGERSIAAAADRLAAVLAPLIEERA